MRRWTGGVVILALALLLITRHALLLASTYAASPQHLSPSLPAASPPVLSALLHSHRIPGLDDLFPARNFTALPPQLGTFNSSMAVWAHMRALLLRSDALPGTADGVLEASIAWKELGVSLGERIDGKEASFVLPDAAQLEKRSCPFSISGSGSSVTIPCGFVEDSAVTLVGSPVGVNGSGRFWIQLAGSGLPDAQPFVLHYNVSFGEDGPALAQNSRTPDKGWGVWEFCPSYGFGSIESNPKVDGLVRCNEQLAESMISKTSNGSLSNNSKPHEPSKRSSQLSSGFPFIEGLPFTATLWAGMEGLHMTVNGRHETSFAYRESLEPWLISEVRVGGDLNLHSLLMNGLPISEDPDLVDMEILRAPPLPKKRLLMLVGVFSTANNFKQRMALRRSWMQYEAVRSGSVAVRFLIGFHKNKQVNLELWREAQTYNDIQMMPFVDYYSLITLKTVATCILGAKILPAKYIMKTDDDAFVRIDEILSNLKRTASKALLYGQISFESSPHRDEDSKWFISPEEWPDEFYPPWAHGPGYIISRDIAKFIVQGHQERYLRLFKLEDVAMGIWIQEYNRSAHEVNYVNDDRFHNDGCEPNYILAHYQMPRLLLCLWEKLQKEQEAICCE
ncbi:hydroxyproline O-galactosyltransferase GALT3-like [Zingiber officinale]|uniref:hydroxyproline O-galactosyltransferase GALT3-like n=1 Tax=Zingiber officinale TaxID=94328 RepID=UPI001C4D402A|nr:hydroxyproline O-galactosyltransferase GALT3-like [Zingiber officinale]